MRDPRFDTFGGEGLVDILHGRLVHVADHNARTATAKGEGQ
jgi:hypothetical protein